MAEELKACPFCGGKAETVQFTKKRWTVECFADGCGAGIISQGDMQTAIAAWNNRAQVPSQGGEAVAELSSDEILMAFEENGFRIEPGASFSAKGQIAQLLNAVGAILSAHPADQVADAARWQYYAPKVAAQVGVTLEEMNATSDDELLATPSPQ